MFLFTLLQGEISENIAIMKLNRKLETTAKELRIANTKLEEFAKVSQEHAKIKERNRLAREIHDILGHTLTSITMGVEACLAILPYDVTKANIQLQKILGISKKGLLDVRQSVRELKFDAADKAFLIPSLERLANDINECTNTKVDIIIKGVSMKLHSDEEQTVFRIIQESVTNSMRHGAAKHIRVILAYENHEINITIQDDGIGCKVINTGFGLKHMKERVKMLNGEIEFESVEGKGFMTKVNIPIRWGDAYD